jgi:hypothetical protein
MCDPSCSDSVALVAVAPNEEQQLHAIPDIFIPSESSLTSVTATVEVENSEGLIQNYIVNSTKRKLDWLTDNVAVGRTSRSINLIVADPASKQSQLSTIRAESPIGQPQPDLPDTEEDPADSWNIINTEIRKCNIPLNVPTTAKTIHSTLNIGSLNITGRDTASSIHRSSHKFRFLKRMINEEHLGILAMQETHLDDAGAAQFHDIYQNWFQSFHSAHPSAPTSTAGVVFLLNKKFVDVEHVRVFVLIPGRALMINVPCHKGQTLTILNIYCYIHVGKGRKDRRTERAGSDTTKVSGYTN